MKSCIVAIAKDEASYLAEWASYHLALGFDRIFLYDNDSSDNPKLVLEPFLEFVEIINWPTVDGISPQLSAYNNPSLKLRDRYDFAAFIDIDEFITLRDHSNITDYLAGIPDTVSAIAINQKVFGSSHLNTYEDKPVTLRFQHCAPEDHAENLWFKSIYRTSDIRQINSPHKGDLLRGSYADGNFSVDNVDPDSAGLTKVNASQKIHINHYILKSKEEFETKKKLRGGGMESSLSGRLHRYDNDYFFSYRDTYANSTTDTRIVELISELEKKHGKKIYP